MCRWLKISRAAQYSWRRAHHSREDRAKVKQQLLDKIRQADEASRGIYGSQRILLDLEEVGEQVVRHQLALMREAGLSRVSRMRWMAMTDLNHVEEIFAKLLDRNFTVEVPNQAWVGDIMYIRTTVGWQYLATVVDLYRRMIVGWALAGHLRTELVEDALKMACGRCEWSLPCKLLSRKYATRITTVKHGLILHRDRGSRYADIGFMKILVKHGIVQSMCWKGNCGDIAVAESIFSTIKRVKLKQEVWRSKVRLRVIVFDYIEGFTTDGEGIRHWEASTPWR